jgi:CRISPR type III-A-associated RAMP protein Csm5
VDIIQDREDKIIQKRRINKEGQRPIEVPKLDKNKNKLLYADKIEKELFGRDPNNDIFRFIRVGDAYFDRDSTIATRMINLNITRKDELVDKSKPQLIEAIGSSETSTFSLNVTADYYKWVKSKFPTLGNLPAKLQSVSGLFSLINMHTQKLIEDEIEYWKNVEKIGAEYYIETLEDLLEEVKECRNESSCVLRIGHGSGWRFITGAWTEQLSNFKTDVINAARPQNYRYSEYDFPKTRRVDEDSYVLGFVKLTME